MSPSTWRHHVDLDLRGISLLDFERVRPVVQAGYDAAMPRLEAGLETQGTEGSDEPPLTA